MNLPDEETYQLQMAAIGVGALANTRKTAQEQRIPKDNPYWTPPLEDVYAAVDREMTLREDNERLRAALRDIYKSESPDSESVADWAQVLRDQQRKAMAALMPRS
jgi:hypothetical protein